MRLAIVRFMIVFGLCLLGSKQLVLAQCQVDKVTASAGNANAGDHFGWSVAVNGNYAVVGAEVADGGGSNAQADTGAAFLLQRDGLNWVEIRKLVADDNLASVFDAFGTSVAISNNAERIVVGAPMATGNLSVNQAGAAYVFQRYQDTFPCAGNQDCAGVGLTTCMGGACEGLTWAVETILRADDPATADEFGFSVDISGDVVVVGAWKTDNGFLSPSPGDAGAAYVFRRYKDSFPCQSLADCQEVGLNSCVVGLGACEGVTWLQEQRLKASDPAEQAFFGNSVAIEGGRIVVGARSFLGPGGAYIFEHNGTNWGEVQKLTASDGLEFDAFGQAVDLQGDAIVVTAINADPAGVSNAGKTYVYRRIGGTYGDEQILTASNGLSSDRFGRSVSIHGDNLLIGARDTDLPGSQAGSAYLFNFDGTNWNEVEVIVANDAAASDRFGHAVSLSETYGLVGAYRNDDDGIDSGSAYVFAIGLGRDCNENLIPDDCEVLAGTEPDTNGNGTPDACECQSDGDCPGGDACSAAICNQDSLCEIAVNAGFCRIDGVCYSDGATNPLNSCEVCNAANDRRRFTSAPGAPPCEDDGNDCTLDICVIGFCSHQRLEEATACGDPIETECNLPDTCDAEGNCRANDRPADTPCTPDGSSCVVGKVCDGAGMCGVYLPEGTVCTDDGDPCTDDLCDGVGACEHIDDGTKVCPGTVKSHQKISKTQGNFTGGIGNSNRFGSSVALIGDLDGDRVGDLAVGAPRDGSFSSATGALWVLFLNADGTVKSDQKIRKGIGGFNGTLFKDDEFGSSVTSLGDLDDDGVVDLAVGAPRDDDGSGSFSDRGAVWILFLNPDGTVKTHQKISDTEGDFDGALDDNDAFGFALACVGDLDGDGVSDLAVGATGDNDAGPLNRRGAVWILFLNPDGTVKSHQKISATQGNFLGSLSNNDGFGGSVAFLGDLDGDGVGDLAVGAVGDGDGGASRGAVWVLFLNNDGTVKSHQKISDTQGGFTGVLDDGDLFGSAVALLGDLDGDGVRDVTVGARLDDDDGSQHGAAWVLFLNTDGTVKSHQKISDTQGAFTGNLDGNDEFGWSIVALGDLDGDGVGDLAVGARGDQDGSTGGIGVGAVWILFLEGAPSECFGAPVGAPCTDIDNVCADVACVASVCDGAGTCGANLPEGTVCPDDGNPCTENVCNGIGGCGVYLPVGTICPGDGNPCTDDVCDGAGGCGVINLPSGTDCPDDGNPCTDNVCDGAGGCLVNDVPKGTGCTDDGDPCTDDMCDGAGTCEHTDDGTRVCPGTVQSHQKISGTEGNFTGALSNRDLFGYAVASLGDLDGDGVVDMAVGAPFDDDGDTDSGAVWVLFLNGDGSVKTHQKISQTQGGFTGTLESVDWFGKSVASLGDLDGDGVVDLAVGAPQDRDGGPVNGAVWILFLNSDGTVKKHQKISATEGGFTGVPGIGDRFGISVASLGDLDGDGVRDLAVGAEDVSEGAVWVLFLNSDGTVKSYQRITSAQGGFTGMLGSGDQFGLAVASLGDLDGDGVGDLAVGEPGDSDGGTNRGAVWLLFLNSDGTVKSHQKISDTEGGFIGRLVSFDAFGSSLATLGDLNGDGVVDLAVGARRDVDGDLPGGAVWVLFLNDDGTVKTHQKISNTQGGFNGTLGIFDWFGISAAALGDVDGDGVVDLAVGAFGDDDGGEDRGAVWVLFLDGAFECGGAVDGTPCLDDGIDCTGDMCVADVCEHPSLAVGAPCGDAADGVCDSADTCDGAGNCQSNVPADGTPCDDPVFCNGIETCVSGVCRSNGDPCVGSLSPICDEEIDVCFACPSDEFCDDGFFCNGAEQCIAGACSSPGDPCAPTSRPNCDELLDSCYLCRQDADCDDGNECTLDRCEQAFCVHPPAAKGSSCGESSTSPCDLPDSCDGVGNCLENLAPDGTLCQDELFCNGKEFCVAGVCAAATDPCAGSEFPVCDEVSNACLSCSLDNDCDDGLACTDDVCVLGQCIHPWAAVNTPCGDQRPTPCDGPDVCDGFGSCVDNTEPDGSSCDDRLFCTGEDTCLDGVCRHAGDGCAEAGLFCDEFLDSCSETPPPTVIYSNTFGEDLWRPQPTSILVADDIVTNAVDDCLIRDVTIRVNGGIPGGGGVFSVSTSIWDGCPSIEESSIVAGTDRVFIGLDDDNSIDHDLQLLPPGGPVVLPPTFWIQISFSTRRSGWVVDKPATTGFSGDWYDHPFTGCNTYFGGWPTFPHASGYVVVRAEDPCGTTYPAYRAISPMAPTFVPPLGAANRIADDLLLVADDCVLAGYELAMRGVAGPYEMAMDLRVAPEAVAIPGTKHVFVGKGEGSIEVVRFTVPPEVVILIPQHVWMTWQANKPSTGVLNVGRTQVGRSTPFFAGTHFAGEPGWTRQLSFSDRDAIFYITVFCRGEAPLGACCPAQEPGATVCQDDVTAHSCGAPDPRCGVIIDCPDARWSKDRCCGSACCVGGDHNNQTCADNVDCPGGMCVAAGTPPAFDPPCGAHACCQPGQGGKQCDNLFFDECQAITDPREDARPCELDRDCPGERLCEGNGFCEPKRSRWSSGEFCGVSKFECPIFSCFDGEGDCFEGSPEIVCNVNSDCPGFRTCLVPPQGFHICESRRGCGNIECCDRICSSGGAGNFCCEFGWDDICVGFANQQCADIEPGNDFCFDSSQPSLGALEIKLNDFGFGVVRGNNSQATLDRPVPEPGFCCHNAGVDRQALGTMWYWFEAKSESALIDTCDSIVASDTLLQVFAVGHPDQGRCVDGSICSVLGQNCIDGTTCVFDEQDACDTLPFNAIGCNDDAGGGHCGQAGKNSSVCVSGLTVGERYYILLGAGSGLDTGSFEIDIRSPCPDAPPLENLCIGATTIVQDVEPFDLTSTSLNCPSTECVESMKNDIWKLYDATCTGQLTVHTCEGTAAASPATGVVIYQVPFGATVEDACGNPNREVPFPAGLLLGCSDDADFDKACSFSGDACDTLNDCKGKRCTLNNGLLCHTDADCKNECKIDPDCLNNCTEKFCTITGELCTDDTGVCLDFGICATFSGAVTESACSINGQACQSDTDCTEGRCANDDFTVCDTTDNTCPFGRCAENPFVFCQTEQDCSNQGVNVACERWPCDANETCDEAECTSASCGESAYVTAPVFTGQQYLIRVGSEFGEELTGNLTVSCEPIDCNENGGPDEFDILVGASADCNGNSIPDECELLRDSVPGIETFCDAGCEDDCNVNGTIDVCEIDQASRAAHCGDGMACNVGGSPCIDGTACEGGLGTYFCEGAAFGNCDQDANNNGIPDECDLRPLCTTLVANAPPNCAIDARQPSTIDGLTIQGWTAIDVTVGPAGCTLASGDLSVESKPTGPAPTINNVSQDGDVTTITFDSVIPVENWTCVSLATDASQQVCLGNLPGDVDGDGTSNPALDLSALIDCINNPGSCSAWQEDIDRTGGAAGVLDITRLIDLFNGAGAYNSWTGASFSGVACPSN